MLATRRRRNSGYLWYMQYAFSRYIKYILYVHDNVSDNVRYKPPAVTTAASIVACASVYCRTACSHCFLE